jgi:NitT/TauT family transport system substrate-binding protein
MKTTSQVTHDRTAVAFQSAVGVKSPTAPVRCTSLVAALLAGALLSHSPARADDTLKIAIGQRGNWETGVAELGQRAGIFKKHGLHLDILFTNGSGETLQAVISGGADIGVGTGTAGVMAAYAKGAPVRIIGAGFTGANDLYWYVRADSPIHELTDATEQTTIAYGTTGSSVNLIVLGFLKQYGLKAKPTQTGDLNITMIQVMSGQVDIGWGAPPSGLQALEDSKIRIVARGSDLPSTKYQTVRVLTVNANRLANSHDAIARFVQAYRETIEWMYSDTQALKTYQDYSGIPERLTRKAMTEFYSKEGLNPDRISGLDEIMTDAIAMKFLSAPLTEAQLADLIQVPKLVP